MADSNQRLEGILHVAGGNGALTLEWGAGKQQKVKSKHFEESSRSQLAALQKGKSQKLRVTFELVGGQPKDIRIEQNPSRAGSAPKQGGGSRQPEPKGQSRLAPSVGNFHNPYNFVPAPPRPADHAELGDHKPIGRHVLYPDRFTGVIRVKMTVNTPLLVPDAGKAADLPDDHKSFPVRLDADGQPYIPPTSIKGMLRSAYEAVTNSRLAVFPGEEGDEGRNAAGHGMRLAFRRPAKVEVVPARVEECSPLRLNLRILSRLWLKSAAKLPRYRQHSGRDLRKGEDDAALRYADGSLPKHGDHVLVQVDPKGKVLRISPYGERSNKADGWQEGWVLITEPNIGNKKFERVYVVSDNDQVLTLSASKAASVRRMWNELIANYRNAHVKDLANREKQGQKPNDYLGDEPGKTAWSRHIWDDDYQELREGTLCYLQIEGKNVKGIFPVSISRDLYSSSPLSLLPQSLRPAAALQQLSPADRVFGWVNQRGKGACKGHVRVGPVTCRTPKEQAVEDFGQPGLPLAILGQPKPQQARFYVAASQSGEAQKNGLSKESAGYSRNSNKGLRGRKVYPHHNGLPPGYWKIPKQDRTQQAIDGYFQEYRRPKLNGEEQRDSQNRSIQGWVNPGTEFTFEIHVTNLSQVELGALLWLLSLPENHYHRFGGGKPLGFGSVRLEIESSSLYDGRVWKRIYSTLDDEEWPTADHEPLIQAFHEAVQTQFGKDRPFDQVPFIAAFLRAATGHPDRLPTHYPRARRFNQTGPVPPHPEGLAYEWFVANDRTGKESGPALSLPDLVNDNGLPILDRKEGMS
ncbi:TIGR03986 family type III CRISPR-associated RAMP protein [Thermopirellula anaerolimosa]